MLEHPVRIVLRKNSVKFSSKLKKRNLLGRRRSMILIESEQNIKEQLVKIWILLWRSR